jgi:hypothetical protein
VQYLVVHNPLPRPLHLLLDVSCHQELRGSRHVSQVGAQADDGRRLQPVWDLLTDNFAN